MSWKKHLCRWALPGLMLFCVSCWSDPDPEELPIEEDSVTTADDLAEETEEYAETRRDNVRNRVMELMQTAHRRTDTLDLWDDTENISDEARLTSNRLRDELEQLRQNLKASLDSVDDAGEEGFERMEHNLQQRLEKTEDELDQIDKEMSEWHDENIN